jgi:hypothetical protein
MARQLPSPPGPAGRTKGAEAVAFRAAMVVAAMGELSESRSPGQALAVHTRNSPIQSTLIDLRALIGFLLIDANDVVPKPGGGYRAIASQPADVRPSWYIPTGQAWFPRGVRRRRALHSFYGPVGTRLAHIAVKARLHPGQWPLIEAALVVGHDLGALLDTLAAVAPKEAQRFVAAKPPLTDTLAALASRSYAPYAADSAEPQVRRARRLLRTQLGWPAQ